MPTSLARLMKSTRCETSKLVRSRTTGEPAASARRAAARHCFLVPGLPLLTLSCDHACVTCRCECRVYLPHLMWLDAVNTSIAARAVRKGADIRAMCLKLTKLTCLTRTHRTIYPTSNKHPSMRQPEQWTF